MIFRLALAISILTHYYIESTGLPYLSGESFRDLLKIPKHRPYPQSLGIMKPGIRVFWCSLVCGTTDIKYRNQTNSSTFFEIYHRYHPTELIWRRRRRRRRKEKGKGKREEKSLNQYINLYLLFKENHLHTYCCFWSWLDKILEKIIIKVHGILCWHKFQLHNTIPLRRMLIW